MPQVTSCDCSFHTGRSKVAGGSSLLPSGVQDQIGVPRISGLIRDVLSVPAFLELFRTWLPSPWSSPSVVACRNLRHRHVEGCFFFFFDKATHCCVAAAQTWIRGCPCLCSLPPPTCLLGRISVIARPGRPRSWPARWLLPVSLEVAVEDHDLSSASPSAGGVVRHEARRWIRSATSLKRKPGR